VIIETFTEGKKVENTFRRLILLSNAYTVRAKNHRKLENVKQQECIDYFHATLCSKVSAGGNYGKSSHHSQNSQVFTTKSG